MKKITLLFTLLCFSFGYAQTFTDNGGPYDTQNGNGTIATTCGTVDELALPIAVTGVGTLTAGALELREVGIDITHTFDGDLDVFLVAPDGTTTIELFTDVGGSGENFTGTVISDDGATFASGAAPFTGDFVAEGGSLAATFDGLNADGNWTLQLCDDAPGDTGTLNSWSLTFGPPPSCPNPTALVVTGITETTADLGWTSAETNWEYVVQAPGTGVPGGAGTATTSNPVTAMGLTAETTYEFYVRADCAAGGGTDISTWAGPVEFTTDCAALTAPYVEDFETFTTSTTPFSAENCWSASFTSESYFWESAPGTDTSSTGTGPDPIITTGNYFFTESSGSAIGDIADLVAPSVDLTSLTTPTLSFNYHMVGGQIGTLDVLVNGTDNVFTVSGQQQTTETELWLDAVVDLSAYAGQTIFVIIRATGAGSFEGDIAIDNFSIDEPPSCISPMATTTLVEDCGNLQFSVDVDVTSLGDATSVTISNDGGVAATTGITTTGIVNVGPFPAFTPVVITIEHEQDPTCDVDLAPVVDACPPPPPACGGNYYDSGGPVRTYSANESTTVTISPDNAGDGVLVTFTYVDIEANANGGNCPFDFLTVYDGPDDTAPVLFASLCGEESGDGDVPSDPAVTLSVGQSIRASPANTSGALTFVFTSDGSVQETGWEATVSCNPLSIPETNFEGFRYFPNPVSGALSLRAQNNIENVSIFNILGQEVVRSTPNALVDEVDMSNLQTGAYFVKVTINGATETVRIVKQ